jgi:phosphoserine phosphatase
MQLPKIVRSEIGAEPRSMTTPAFATVALDVDSTVSGIEGIDWLARRRGDIVARKITSLTDDAMRGVIPLEEVYGARLEAIRPGREDVAALSSADIERAAPGCATAVAAMRGAGVHLLLVSGGLRYALLPLALELGFDPSDVHAVDIVFDGAGAYAGFDRSSPLTTSAGKGILLAGLSLARPLLMVGDGATDLAARDVVDSFIAFTGFAAREDVVRRADQAIASFPELASIVLRDR